MFGHFYKIFLGFLVPREYKVAQDDGQSQRRCENSIFNMISVIYKK